MREADDPHVPIPEAALKRDEEDEVERDEEPRQMVETAEPRELERPGE
jgi:hypothetical protein